MADGTRSRNGVSIKSLLLDAVFTHGNDLQVESCSPSTRSVTTKQFSHLFVAGLDASELDDERADRAIELGATAVLTERILPLSVPQVIVKDVRDAYAKISHALARNPSKKMLTIGVLGTHGKTSVALMIASMMKKIGGVVAYHTSLGCKPVPAAAMKSNAALTKNNSTPTSVASLHQWMKQAAKEKTPAIVIELDEEMLRQRVAAGIEFDILVVPSLRRSQRASREQSRCFENAVERTMKQLKDHGLVVYNADDARLNRWIERHGHAAISYGLDADALVCGRRISRENGSQSMMVSAGRCLMPFTTPMIGDHNLRNQLAAITVGYAFGLELFEVIGGIEQLTSIPGRMQQVVCGQDFSVVVDSANDADRLAVALHSMALLGGRVTCVAEVPECADNEQRAAFGRVLSRSAGQIILTQSRQSSALGQKHIWEVMDGCDNPAAIHVVPDRAAAIELALRSAQHGDRILLAGWGHEGWTTAREKQVFRDNSTAMEVLYTMAREEKPSKNKAAIIVTE